MPTPAVTPKPPSRTLPIVQLVFTAIAGGGFFVLERYKTETENQLTFFHPMLVFLCGAVMAILFFWAPIAGLRSRLARGIVAGLAVPVVTIGAVGAAFAGADSRIQSDFDRTYAQRMEVIHMLQQGKLPLEHELSPDYGQRIHLPPGYESLAHMEGEIEVWGDPQSHTITKVVFYETGGCMGDCETEYVYVADDKFVPPKDSMTDARHLRQNWYWADIEQ